MASSTASNALAVGSFEETWLAHTFALDDDSVVDAVEALSDSESSGFDGAALAVLVDVSASGIDADVVELDEPASGVAAACFELRIAGSRKHSQIWTTQTVN